MKKFIVFAVVLALLVPAAAFAVTEFTLGGFIKLDTMWDSDGAVGKNLNGAPLRNNDANANHGRLKFTAQGSRFNMTIKGPQLWGAQVTGFIEMDFDTSERPVAGTAFTASNSYTPRLRHAMFRFNWPTSELLFGQYWSMFCEWYSEMAEDGPLQLTGTPTARLAQIRFSQKFAGAWTVAGLVGDPNQANLGTAANFANGPYNANINNGQSAETPQVQGKVQFQQDLWGKAAYYGVPTPFTAQVVGGWQRNIMRSQGVVAASLGNNTNGTGVVAENALTAATINVQNQYLNPWLAMGSLFVPVIPTHSANLAGTASILANWWIGQGVETFGFTGISNNLYQFNNNSGGGTPWYDAVLLKKFGGFVQGQYYFNNQWFMDGVYAVSKAYNVDRSRMLLGGHVFGANNMEWATGDNAQTIQQMAITLWYRPIQAIKFGLQYEYAAARYFQYILPTAATNGIGTPANNVNRSAFGQDNRVEFVGFFYF
ncbi:MAG: hypothetical protein ACLP2P_03015 [Desulfobaccales bacterium]